MDGRPIKTNESFSHERERETIFIKKHWPAVAIFTDGRDDGDGIKKSSADGPLAFGVVDFFAVVTFFFGRLDHLVLESYY